MCVFEICVDALLTLFTFMDQYSKGDIERCLNMYCVRHIHERVIHIIETDHIMDRDVPMNSLIQLFSPIP